MLRLVGLLYMRQVAKVKLVTLVLFHQVKCINMCLGENIKLIFIYFPRVF